MAATETPQTRRALIVDWGGVLTMPVGEAFRVWLEDEGLSETHFVAVMVSLHNTPNSILHQVERGEAPRQELEREIAAGLTARHGRAVDPEKLLSRMFAAVESNAEMTAVLQYAHDAGWRTAVLSNSWGNPYDEPLLESLVDVVLLSDRIGVRKPDSACYELAAATLGVRPDACIFVDDLRRNVRGAQRVGMTAFLYCDSTASTLRDLIGKEQR
jgi:putative hydrolase of the HAD superfamily